jgi:four helix bundle protein
MNTYSRTTKYDLEERTFQFSKRVRWFVKQISSNTANLVDSQQLIRSSGSVGANYIEANESVGRKDFLFKIKICRKEAKESSYWLRLLELVGPQMEVERERLVQEATELSNIFGAILRKSEASKE